MKRPGWHHTDEYGDDWTWVDGNGRYDAAHFEILSPTEPPVVVHRDTTYIVTDLPAAEYFRQEDAFRDAMRGPAPVLPPGPNERPVRRGMLDRLLGRRR